MTRTAAVVLLLSFGSVSAFAQDEDRAKAAQLVDEGNKQFEAKQFMKALETYEEAYGAFPSPKILFNIAEAKRELGQSVEAANAYAAFINEASVDPSSAFGVKAREELESLDRQVARLAFEGDLEGAAVTIDGQPLDRFAQREVRVEAGSHSIRATREGVKGFATTVTARAGVPTPVAIELSETPSLDAKADRSAEERLTRIAETPKAEVETQPSPTSQWWFWTAIGGAAVIAVVITAVAVSSGGSDRLPMGELPTTSTADWMRGP